MFIFIDVPILNCFFLPYKYPLEKETHVAYLIELGFSTVEIAERLGHENISVTSTYSHLYPSKQRTMADRMDRDRNNDI